MRYRLILGIWIITDLLLFIGSYALAYFVRVGWILSTDFPFNPYITVVAIVAPLWLIVLISTRTFALNRSQFTLSAAAFLFYSCVVGNALFALAYFFIYGLFFSRLLLLEALAFSTVAVWIWHMAFEKIKRRLLAGNPPVFPTLIIGVTRESKRLVSLLRRELSPLFPVAILDVSGSKEKEINGVPVIGRLDKLEDTLETFGITHLIQCSDLEQSINLLSACRSRRITYLLLPSVLGIVEQGERIESLEGYAVTSVNPNRNWLMRLFM